MKLSQIKLSGFKSFASSTTIDVSGNLIGIVGPNGCGKSNVIDAIRWVLGESNAKQLRGESMQDVIFNGSSSRKAISRATVELVFDNSAKIISGLWSTYDEIAIKRLISRSGESQYYINNQVVRRRDITDLFLGTGVGTKGYAVIEQGMISRIIDAKAEELMLYLEEASGVSKYRLKRKETIIKLKDTTDNLSRIEDIRNELEKQVTYLRGQAVATQQYQRLTEDLKTQQILCILLKIDKADTILKEVNQNIIRVNAEIAQDDLEVIKFNNQLSSQLVIKSQKDEELGDLTNQFNTLRTNIVRLEERNKNRLNLHQRLQLDKDKLEQEMLELHSSIDEYNQVIKNTIGEITLNSEILEEKQILREDKLINFEHIEDVYKHSAQVVTEFSDEISTTKHELDLLRNSVEHKKHQLNSLSIRVKRLEQEKAANTLDFNQSYFLIKDNIADLAVELEHIEVERIQAKESKGKLYEEINTKTAQLNLYKNEITALDSKLTTINELLQKQVVSASGFDFLQSNISSDALRFLWQNIEVSIGYELAVEVVLGDLLKAVKVDNLNKVKVCPESIVAVWGSDIKGKPHRSENQVLDGNVFCNLDSFVTIKNNDFCLVSSILAQYLVCDNFFCALPLLDYIVDNQKIITKDGHMVTKNYVIFNANSSQNHILEYQNKLAVLESELNSLQLEYAKLDKELSINNVLYTKLEHNVTRLEELYTINHTKKHNLQLELTKEEQIYIQNRQFQERVTQDLKLLAEEINHVQNSLDEIQVKLGDLEVAQIGLCEKRQFAELNKIECEKAYNLSKTFLNVIDVEINDKLLDSQLLKQKITSHESLIKDKTIYLESALNKIESLTLEVANLITDTESPELEKMQQELSINVSAITVKNTEINEISAANIGLKNNINKFSQRKDMLLNQLNQQKLMQQEQVILLQNHNEAIQEITTDNQYIDVAKTKIKKEIRTTAEIQVVINDLQQQIEVLGLVNLKAIEDLEICEAKHRDLSLQIEDLISALNSLEGAIKQIDQETRNILNTTYAKVCASFAGYFKTLFGGGDATLELTDKDILKAGMQIFATPPGKKNSSIHLLSGGEKALTAMSLVFAFFSLNPAPFCLLDEVDAPLDDTNTARFCNLVQELSNNTQFVYISHNRLTMEMAAKLIGVTMQEKGISTTVSVDLVDAVKHINEREKCN
ncbi:MAG: chromosome segregation protein SMC [Proteobacteria bacterium]|jgi:chromosome segregation protein|nr:chromosome segregation protein SMC [Pseudomonadota bacterium]